MAHELSSICREWHGIKGTGSTDTSVILTDLKVEVERDPKWISSEPTSHLKQSSQRSLSVDYGSCQAVSSEIQVEKDVFESEQVTITRGHVEIPGLKVDPVLTLPLRTCTQIITVNLSGRASSSTIHRVKVKKTCYGTQRATATIQSPEWFYIGRFTCCLRVSGKVIFGSGYEQCIGEIIRDLQEWSALQEKIDLQKKSALQEKSDLRKKINSVVNMFTVDYYKDNVKDYRTDALWTIEGEVEKRWKAEHTVSWS